MSIIYSLERRYPNGAQAVYFATMEIDHTYLSKLSTKIGYVESNLRPTNNDFVSYVSTILSNPSTINALDLNSGILRELVDQYTAPAGSSNPYFSYFVPNPSNDRENFVVQKVLPGFIDFMCLKASIFHRYFEVSDDLPPFQVSAMVQTEDTVPTGMVKFLGSSSGGKLTVTDADGSVAEIPVPFVKLSASSRQIVDASKKIASICSNTNGKFSQIEREMTDRLNRCIKEVKETAFASMFKDVNLLLSNRWQYETISGNSYIPAGDYLSYPDTITPIGLSLKQSVITKRIIDENTMITIPLTKTMSEKMFVRGILVPVGSTIQSPVAFGYYPHKDNDNPERLGALCVGDILGKNITNLVQLPHNLLVVNWHSMFGNKAADNIRAMVARWQKSYLETGILPTERKRSTASSMFTIGTEFGDGTEDVSLASVDEEEGDWEDVFG